MDKESIFELQKIDCNCNDCTFMQRDFVEYKKWEDWNRNLQEKDFNKRKEHAFEVANATEDGKSKKSLLFIANKMKFQFDRVGLINYGDCLKLNKKVSFIPGHCQLETQECFKHRKEL